MSDDHDMTLAVQRFESADTEAAARILPLVYDELRKLAASKMRRELSGQTLQPTALVHEAWLRLGADKQPRWVNRAQFFVAAAEAMRRIVVDSARRRKAARRGGSAEKVSASATGFDIAAPQLDDAELLLLNEALVNLAAHDARKAELVKQWYFVGLTLEEVAETMGVSLRTVSRDWVYARAWLMSEMERLRA